MTPPMAAMLDPVQAGRTREPDLGSPVAPHAPVAPTALRIAWRVSAAALHRAALTGAQSCPGSPTERDDVLLVASVSFVDEARAHVALSIEPAPTPLTLAASTRTRAAPPSPTINAASAATLAPVLAQGEALVTRDDARGLLHIDADALLHATIEPGANDAPPRVLYARPALPTSAQGLDTLGGQFDAPQTH
jgi:hypothetical protein